MAKLYASEVAVKAADDCVQIHGGYGFVKDYPGREVLPRREAPDHRRGHERDPAPRHRPPAARPVTDRRSLGACARRRSARDRARDLADRGRGAAGAELIRRIFPNTGRAYLVGVTGPPGAGKSTLVDRLIVRAAQGWTHGRRGRRRSDQPVQRRRDPRRSGAHAGARRRQRRVHPQHGDARPSGRAGARDERGGAGARRRGQGRRPDRDRRRRPGRSRHRAHRRRLDRDDRAGQPATRCRRSRPASWRSPTSSS